jgi:hypothetical protein
MTFFATSPLSEEFVHVLVTLVRVVGRRVYELYRGKRIKKLLVNLHKDFDKHRHLFLPLFLSVCLSVSLSASHSL